MARDITSAISTELQSSVITPVLIGRLDIASDPLTAWTGPGTFAPSGSGDTALDGQIFTPVAPFVRLSEITEDRGFGGPVTLTVSGHDLDEELLRQIIRDKRQWRGQGAYLWMGLLDTNQYSVLADPFRIKTGVIVEMKILRSGDEAVVEVIIDEDLGNARSAPFRWQDHPRFFSADTFGTFVVKLANKPAGIESNAIYIRSDQQPKPGGPGGEDRELI